MADRPILFSGPMVRAILSGAKTQTRRALNPQPNVTLDYTKGRSVQRLRCVGLVPGGKKGLPWWQAEDERGPINAFADGRDSVKAEIGCPYGQVGDYLWVRETFSVDTGSCSFGGVYSSFTTVTYRAGGEASFEYEGRWEDDPYLKAFNAQRGDWRPSIYMPRWAARILLEVTAVRVERLQDISRSDAKAEGFLPGLNGLESWAGQSYGNAQEAYRACWDSLNAMRGYSWNVNPWVWVLEFNRVTPSCITA